jgi:hypothetical protein
VTPEPVFSQIHDFLGSPAALYCSSGVGKESRALLKVANGLPSVIDMLVGVIAANLLAAK